MRRFSEVEKTLIWERRSEGVGMRTVARELGRAPASVRTMVEGSRRSSASSPESFAAASISRGAGGDLSGRGLR